MNPLLLALGAAATALAATNTTIHGITVGANGMNTFGPSTVFATVGDILQFTFYPNVRFPNTGRSEAAASPKLVFPFGYLA